jgi:hypothetical protein
MAREDKGIPQISHKIRPAKNKKNIPRDKSLVDLDRHVLITCGRKETENI